jgi:hypothetical protein
VEGQDDVLFAKKILKPIFKNYFLRVEIRQYAQIKAKKLQQILFAIHEIGDSNIVFGDIDHHPCITSKKTYLNYRFQYLPVSHMFIVIQEIESWYLAGLSASASRKVGVRVLPSTNHITKEHFIELKPKSGTRLKFIHHILQHFSVEVAQKKNKSFHYFCTKYPPQKALK